MPILARILHYLRPYRAKFLMAVAQVFVLNGLEILKPWPLKIVLDYVIPRKPLAWGGLESLPPEQLLSWAVVGLVVVYGALGAMSVWNNFTTISIGQAMVNDLRGRLFQHLQRLSLSFYARSTVGDLIFRVTGDSYTIQTLAMNGIFPVLSALVLLGGMFVVMARLDFTLTLVAVAVCPALVVAIFVVNRRINQVAQDAREAESRVYQLVHRGMSSIKVVQAFSKEEAEHEAFVARSTESLRSSLNLYTLQTVFGAGTNLVLSLGTAAVLWLGAQHVWSGMMSLGDMVVFISYLGSLYSPINAMIQTYGSVQGAKAGFVRVEEILNADEAIPDGSQSFAKRPRGDVRYTNVSFAYRGERPTLQNIDVEAPAGSLTAIVGPTGAGKSTLVSLLPRFYDTVSGQVSIDGIDVRQLKLSELRRQISIVLQPPLVFPISIRDNIAYGKPHASDAEVESAARMAQAHTFIEKLPQKYATVIGEAGSTLSEGERQRLTIARALLRDAPILILDEPTSSVDTSTEAAIMEGLEELMRGRTTFVIAHRLSTVRKAHQILVLRDGTITERGTFDELIAQRGFFHQLYSHNLAAADARNESGLP